MKAQLSPSQCVDEPATQLSPEAILLPAISRQQTLL
jgi:hypothetical protein